jgi:hypothetical protein
MTDAIAEADLRESLGKKRGYAVSHTQFVV